MIKELFLLFSELTRAFFHDKLTFPVDLGTLGDGFLCLIFENRDDSLCDFVDITDLFEGFLDRVLQ